MPTLKQIAMRTNYHTHTTRCQHACGTDEEMVLSAIEGGFSVLGFSDHSPWPYTDGFRSHIRMTTDELAGYVASVRSLQERYKDRIEIKLGLECEYFPEYIPWLKQQRELYGLDYLVFGNHFAFKEKGNIYFGRETNTPADLELYRESVLQGMEVGLFDCLAHPDLFMRSYYKFDEHCHRVSTDICRTAHRLGTVLECNYSMRFCTEFWKIAHREDCKVIIGTDAHNPADLRDTNAYNRCAKALKTLEITPVMYL